MTVNQEKQKWYKNFYVWLVIFFPTFAVIAGLSLFFYSLHIDDGVLIDDYYKKGKAINLVLTRDKNADDLGIHGNFIYQPKLKKVNLTLSAKTPLPLNEIISVNIMHATRGNIDVYQKIKITKQEHYQLDIPTTLAKGNWNIEVGNQQWRIQGRIHIPNNYSTSLNALL